MTAIVAVDQNWAIGKNGALLFRIPADLKRFRALTMGHPIIVGRKTLDTFPGGRPLKGRSNLVLSRSPAFHVVGDRSRKIPGKPYHRVYRSIRGLLIHAPTDSVVVGGESVYRALLEYCDAVYVTKIHAAVEGADAFFPNLDRDPRWHAAETGEPQEENGLRFQYVTYRKAPGG